MKKTIYRVILLTLVFVMLFGTVYSSAFEAYDTYTYSIDGEPMKSPTAYTAAFEVDSKAMNLYEEKFGGALSGDVTDIVTDYQGNVYLADKGNNRIVILNQYYQAIGTISSYVDEYGRAQTFNAPQGVFVTDPTISSNPELEIYVCDTDNKRIVVFDKDYKYLRTIEKPSSDLVDEGAFMPTAVAVDKYDRVFVVSPSCYEGIIVMSSKGDFTGFIGAQTVSSTVFDLILRKFQTQAQKDAQEKSVSNAFNNITVNDDGFVYVTTDKLDVAKQKSNISEKAASASPVRMLNSAGKEIMKRNGFFDPGGEVAMTLGATVSKIVDVAIGPEGSWSLLDKQHSRIFTYDENGNLLFAFGDKGIQLGNGQEVIGMAYQEIDGVHYMLVIDDQASTGIKLTVYAPTEYCDTIISALASQNAHKYSEAIGFWQEILKRNNNYDLAYIGIGQALYNQGEYKESMEMLSAAYETTQYAKAFNAQQKDILGKLLLPVVILIVALLVLFAKFLGYAKKRNKAVSLKVGRKTYAEELLYICHLVFHPFDGFWDLRHEKRGSARAGMTILGVLVVALFYNSIGRGYMFNPRGEYTNILAFLAIVVLGVGLWCIANWCLTSLFDGEGRLKDIFIATCYSLAPMPLFLVAATLITNFTDLTGESMVTMLIVMGAVWSGFLLFFGSLVTHDYPLGKNVLITLCTIVAMLVIAFVAMLFFSLIARIVTFVIALASEIGNRI